MSDILLRMTVPGEPVVLAVPIPHDDLVRGCVMFNLLLDYWKASRRVA